MSLSEDKILKSLIDGSYISEEDIKDFRDSNKKNRESILDYFLTEGLISKDIIGQAVAEKYKIYYADLNTNTPSCERILTIPEKIAKDLRIVLYSVKDDELVITTDDPGQKNLKAKLKKIIPNKKIKLAYSLSEDIDSVFSCYEKDLEKKISQIKKDDSHGVIKILESIFDNAINLKASDIHFEPEAKIVLIRFRVDGKLRDVARLDKKEYDNILNRLKVQSGIRFDKHNSAQDGAMQHRKDDKVTDFRVSLVPTVWGEKCVLRLLSSYVQGLLLDDLGLSEKHQKIIKAAAKKPFGMIVVSGPTGSGKTTTLYALLKIVNKSDVNITTIEDPVEYKTKGINQIQVDPQNDLTFSKGLRSVVRQDPDIILVGEIRDKETVQISVNAALTGHLLFSTFHANNAATIVPRLLVMGVEPFLLASTLELLVSQRLARKVCHRCKRSKVVSSKEIAKINPDLKPYFKKSSYTFFEGVGCESCNNTGYSGRVALFELIEISQDIQDLILKNPSSQEIMALARKEGAITMFEDGVEKVKNGLTTIDEVLRVTEIPK